MSIYNEMRPTTFDEMIGDFSNVRHELDNPQGSHVFLFDGITGTGKTTLARVVAKYIGAEEFDFKEINASDATGVDDMRALLDEIDYVPNGRTRVIFVDECHKLSAAAWSLLRTPTEDVASYNYWIFATSNAKKIPNDNRGRMTPVIFAPIDEKNLFALLKDAKTQYSLAVGQDVLAAIAEVSGGSARKALVDLEAIASISTDQQMAVVRRLGTDDDPEIIELAREMYATTSWPKIGSSLKALKDAGVEAETIRRTLLSYGSSMLLSGNVRGAICKHFIGNLYDDGFPGIVVMCYKAKHS